MKLVVLLPSHVHTSTGAAKVTAVSPRGSFTLLPRHVDLVTALVPGIMSWEDAQEHESFLAVDQGLLVKSGDLVQVATRTATAGELGELHQRVDAMLASRREREAGTRTAVARLESGFIRRFMEFERHG